MNDTTPVTICLSKQVKDRLDALAKSTQRSSAVVAAEAIGAYVDANAWHVELISERVRELETGAPVVTHEDVVKWV